MTVIRLGNATIHVCNFDLQDSLFHDIEYQLRSFSKLLNIEQIEKINIQLILTCHQIKESSPLIINNPIFNKNIPDTIYIFCVTESINKIFYQIHKLLKISSTNWHLNYDSLLLHSSCIANNNKGFLFLGKSGSGKSTVSNTAHNYGLNVLGDDLNFLLDSNSFSNPEVAFFPGLKKQNSKHSFEHKKLTAIFKLKKDNVDYLDPLEPIDTCNFLFESFIQVLGNENLIIQKPSKIFKIIAATSRKLPGYVLHFTKSAKFLDVIKTEFPDAF